MTSSIGHIRAGKLRPLGVGSTKRSPTLPDVPTVIEAGVPGYEAANWIGIVATGRHARADRRAAAQGDLTAILDLPEVQKLFAAEGADIVQMGSRAVRRLHGERDGEMGPRRQAGRHQGAVAARLNFYLTDR